MVNKTNLNEQYKPLNKDLCLSKNIDLCRTKISVAETFVSYIRNTIMSFSNANQVQVLSFEINAMNWIIKRSGNLKKTRNQYT